MLYAGALEFEYGTGFVGGHIKGIVDDMMSSQYRSSGSMIRILDASS